MMEVVGMTYINTMIYELLNPILTILQDTPTTPPTGPAVGTWMWIAIGLATTVATIATTLYNQQVKRSSELKGERDDKEKRVIELVDWTRNHSERSIENYAKIINILDKLADDNKSIEDSIAKEIASQLQNLRIEFQKEFNDLRLLIKG